MLAEKFVIFEILVNVIVYFDIIQSGWTNFRGNIFQI